MLTAALRCRRSIAAMEFAMAAPVLLFMVFGVWDITRALLIWQQLNAAAQQIAQAAEKLAISPGATTTSLTATQMQTAMTTIYAAMPQLNLGTGTGAYPGSFAVTLSSVAYLPLCQPSAGCNAETIMTQTPYTLWSSYLTQGGAQLNQTPTVLDPLRRPCSALTSVADYPDNASQFNDMVNPLLVPGATNMILTPQIVADVQYVFTPTFPLFVQPTVFWASANLPTPLGGTDQEFTFDTTPPTGNVVACTVPS
jgi:Flp pilus assembly protein TadG